MNHDSSSESDCGHDDDSYGGDSGGRLGEVLGIAIGTAIEIKIEMEAIAGSEIAIGTAPGGQTGAKTKCPVTKAKEAMQAR